MSCFFLGNWRKWLLVLMGFPSFLCWLSVELRFGLLGNTAVEVWRGVGAAAAAVWSRHLTEL